MYLMTTSGCCVTLNSMSPGTKVNCIWFMRQSKFELIHLIADAHFPAGPGDIGAHLREKLDAKLSGLVHGFLLCQLGDHILVNFGLHHHAALLRQDGGSLVCRTLSLGMKQRLGLAMALLGEPEVLILDEPTNGLDPSGIVEMRAFLQGLNRDKGITIVISSHHLAELEQMATTYAFLKRGCVVEQVSARTLQERCADYVDIAVSDAARFTALLEKELRHERYLVLLDGTVRIFDPAAGIEAYSGLAVRAGMDVSKLERRKMSLEQYYLELKEKGVA